MPYPLPPAPPTLPAAYTHMSLEEMALSACVSAIGRLNSTRNTCDALAAIGLQALTSGDAAASCAANASVLCQVGGSQGGRLGGRHAPQGDAAGE